MREIKFRFWDDSRKVMLYNAGFNIEQEEDNGFHAFNYTDDKDFQSLEIMQYTGLKDKNGVDIYEGDIVRGVDGDKDTLNHVVVFKFGGFEPFTTPDKGCRVDEVNCKVIGNVYQNPELIP